MLRRIATLPAVVCLLVGLAYASALPRAQTPSQITVYVTNTGSKYHLDGCRYLRKSRIPMKLAEARKRYGPCSVCRPPE